MKSDEEQRNALVAQINAHQGMQVLADLRRNIHAHTFHSLVVGGSINGDLDELYLPAINLLLRL